MHRATLSHSRDGWFLFVEDVPDWRLFVGRSYEWLLEKLGDPCCYYKVCDHRPKPCWFGDHPEHHRTVWGRLIDLLPKHEYYVSRFGETYKTNLRDAAQYYQFLLINNKLAHMADTNGTLVFKTELTRDQAYAYNPEFVEDIEALYDEDLPDE